jgi:SH3 domain-containing protein
MPTSRVVAWGLADRRVRRPAAACCGTGFRPAHPQEHRRSAYPSEVILSKREEPRQKHCAPRESDHFMSREFTIYVLAVLLTVSLGFGQNPSAQLKKYRAAYMDVSLRSAPDPATKQVGTIPKGATVEVIEKYHHWIRKSCSAVPPRCISSYRRMGQYELVESEDFILRFLAAIIS